MARTWVTLALLAAAAPLTGCTDGYGYGGGVYSASAYSYDGFYDDYYGPIHDGYWGRNNYFYYRRSPDDRVYRRGGRDHFLRPGGAARQGYRPMGGQFRPQPGVRTPHFSRPSPRFRAR